MRVTLLVDVSGTRNGSPWPPRLSAVDLPDDEADTMVRAGMAKPFDEGDVDRAQQEGLRPVLTEMIPGGEGGLTTETGPVRRVRRTG